MTYTGKNKQPAIVAPQFDHCGYPTDATLSRIIAWDINQMKDCEPWLEYCLQAIEGSGYGTVARGAPGHYELSTGGWSGNEDVVKAMLDNRIGWALSWYSSRRGGHYQFKLLRSIPREEK